MTPIQLATAYSTLANAGSVLKPQIASQILLPGTPDSATTPGMADLSRATVVRSFETAEPTRETVPMPEDTVRGPILTGLTRVIRGPGVEWPRGRIRNPTGKSVFDGRYDYGDLPIAGKTGTAQGAASLPWNDSSAFTGISLDPSRPFTVTAYLEKAGYGAQAAAPVAKCMFEGLQGDIQLDPVQLSDFLDITDTVAAHDSYLQDAAACRPPAPSGVSGTDDDPAPDPTSGQRSRQHPFEPVAAEPQHRLDVDVRGDRTGHRRRVRHLLGHVVP